MNYKKMSEKELNEVLFYAIAHGMNNAAVEIQDFIKFYGKTVEVFKGRKVPVGTRGTVFFVKRKDYSRYGDPWGIYSATTIGIIDETGNKYYTNCENCKII